jgi:hypothetical protein
MRKLAGWGTAIGLAFRRVPGFREWLAQHAADGQVKMTIEMVEEIREGTDDLAKWLSTTNISTDCVSTKKLTLLRSSTHAYASLKIQHSRIQVLRCCVKFVHAGELNALVKN